MLSSRPGERTVRFSGSGCSGLRSGRLSPIGSGRVAGNGSSCVQRAAGGWLDGYQSCSADPDCTSYRAHLRRRTDVRSAS